MLRKKSIFTHPISLLVGAVVLSISQLTDAAPLSLDEQCERQWIIDSGSMSSTSGLTDGTLLKKWRSLEGRCGGTSIYWGRLAMIQLLSNDLQGAKNSLAKDGAGDNSYGYATDAAKVQIQVQERLASKKPLKKSEIVDFENAYQKIVEKYPKWPTGYALLGGMQTLLGKHLDAIKSLGIAQKGDAYQLWGVYRNLTISLSALDKHKEALDAADQAGALNGDLLADPSFVYAVATSHAALGYLDDAENFLKIIATKRPDVKQDPDYIKAVDFYKARRSRVKRE